MKIFLLSQFFCALLSYGQLKLEKFPRLDTKTALKILVACHEESLRQEVNVGIVIVVVTVEFWPDAKAKKWIQDLRFC